MHGRPIERPRGAARAGPRARRSARPWRGRGCSAGRVDGEVAVLRVRVARRRGRAWARSSRSRASVAPLGRFDAYQRRRGAGAARRGDRAAADRRAARRRRRARRRRPPARRGRAGARAARAGGGAAARDGARPGRAAGATTCATTSSAPGLAHVLAVSGQNVMLLATLVLAAGAVFGLPLRTRLLRRARARGALRAAHGRRPVDPARGRDGRRRPRRRARGAAGAPLVRARARRGGDARAEPARGRASPAGSSRSPPSSRCWRSRRRCAACSPAGCPGRSPTSPRSRSPPRSGRRR